jgi:hypothetical protein
VVLNMSRRLNFHYHYLMVIGGGGPAGLAGASGQRLVGSGNVAGADFATVVTRSVLAGPTPLGAHPHHVVIGPKHPHGIPNVRSQPTRP